MPQAQTTMFGQRCENFRGVKQVYKQADAAWQLEKSDSLAVLRARRAAVEELLSDVKYDKIAHVRQVITFVYCARHEQGGWAGADFRGAEPILICIICIIIHRVVLRVQSHYDMTAPSSQ